MAIADIVNNVSKGLTKEVKKAVSGFPLEYIYMGYLVSRSSSIENINENGNVTRDLYLFTYVTLEPVFVALMEDGTYKDLETGIKYPKVEYFNLMSKHIARGMEVDNTPYSNLSRNNYFGIFNLVKFEDIVDKVIDAELNSKEVSLKINTKKKKSFTLLEMKQIYRRYTKTPNESVVKTFVIPPVLKDHLDPIVTVYGLESDFVMGYYGKPDEEIYQDMKLKSEEYSKIKS